MNAIRADGVKKSFGKRTVLCGIDLAVEKGEIFGLLGPSGAGNTTLIKILTGQAKAYGGSAVILGREASENLDYAAQALMKFGLMVLFLSVCSWSAAFSYLVSVSPNVGRFLCTVEGSVGMMGWCVNGIELQRHLA